MTGRGDPADGRTWDSGLSVAEFTVLRAAGFEPVGQVVGAAVYNLDQEHGNVYLLCGSSRPGWASARQSGRKISWQDAYARMLNSNRRTAIDRMAAHCTALGGDGVVATSLEAGPFAGTSEQLEYVALGTAVRAVGAVRPHRPFLSHLSAQDFVKLIETGWVPVDIAMGISIGVRHDDYQTRRSARRLRARQEISGWSELVTGVRRAAGRHFRTGVSKARGDGAVIASMDMKVSRRECERGLGMDHVVEAMCIGTAIASFTSDHRSPRVFPIMPL